jgi:transposase
MDENQKYEIIKKLVESNGNKKTAALKIGCTERTVNRLIHGYSTKGKAFFIHGNRGKKPVHSLSNDTKSTVVGLFSSKYPDANFTHFTEILAECEGIMISPSTVKNILIEQDILSPKAHKATKRALRKKLELQKQKAVTKNEAAKLQHKIIELEDSHPRRPRSSYFGEMLQMDASVHPWFGGIKTQLHAAIDDATGRIVGAYFDHQETLSGYYNVFFQVLTNYGIPYMFYTDRRTVFEYKQKKAPSLEKDTFTQFSYACHQLGVDIKVTSVPQAKGRVERLFQTLQSRLPIDLRNAGVTTIEQANEFLNSYIKKFNDKFALPVDNIKSVFETQPSDEKINLTLAVLADRKIDTGHSIKFENQYFKPVDDRGLPVYYHKGTSAIVIKAFDGKIFASINDHVYELDLIPTHELKSKNFDFSNELSKIPVKRKIPSMIHPWRKSAINKFVKNQISHQDYTYLDIMNTQEIIYDYT